MTNVSTAAHNRSIAARLNFPSKAFIDGSWQVAASGDVFENLNPATNEVLGTVASCDARDVDRAVAAARRSFEDGVWSRVAPDERKTVLLRLADLVRANAEELAVME